MRREDAHSAPTIWRAVGENEIDFRLRAAKRGVGANLNFLLGETAQRRIVVTRRCELRQAERAVVQDGRSGVMRG